MFRLKIITTEADMRLLNTAETLLKKHADPYLDIMGVFVKVQQLIKAKPDQREVVEKIMEEYFQRTNTTKGRDPDNPGQKGRYNAALGDLRNFRAGIRQRLQRGDPPDMLLYDWNPIDPDHPSTLERNAKWWITRNVGTNLVAAGRYDEAERLLLDHVSEFAKVNMEGTDEHLAGCDHLARLYYVKRDWNRAKEAFWGPVATAKMIGREIGSWHVLHSNVLLWEILVEGGEFKVAERLIGEFMPVLKEMALPDITASPMFASMCLRAQMAHVREDWIMAIDQWRQAYTLGQSVGWPEEVGLAIPKCSLEAVEWQMGRETCSETDWANWKGRLFAKTVQAGKEEDFLDGFGDAWKEGLAERVRRVRDKG
ncbi:hypothetical protein P7C71_g3533, partial [Lecanoromycetidae sp. Uapishka_2]